MFGTGWYRAEYGLSAEESPLRHYLARRMSGAVSPLPEFDVVEYCQSHPEILVAGLDPFEEHCKRSGEGGASDSSDDTEGLPCAP